MGLNDDCMFQEEQLRVAACALINTMQMSVWYI